MHCLLREDLTLSHFAQVFVYLTYGIFGTCHALKHVYASYAHSALNHMFYCAQETLTRNTLSKTMNYLV